MALKIAVLAKQVIDPEMPMAAFRLDSEVKKVVTPPNIPPVVNGFDENAVEAALRLKDAQEATITVISSGTGWNGALIYSESVFRSVRSGSRWPAHRSKLFLGSKAGWKKGSPAM